MEFRSLADLGETISRNAYKVPGDIELVVGIPRSGLLAANLLALQLNLPLQDLDGFLLRRTPTVGRTVRGTMKSAPTDRPSKVLVVDDSILSGESMREVRERVSRERGDVDAVYCAIYGAHDRHEEVDFCLEAVPEPRVFQWNLMRHGFLKNACLDIDGVLCHDPHGTENDDGENYLAFLLSARPLHRPHVKVKHLVTSRLEKYRGETEQWLREHGVEYERLWMLDLPSAEERRRLNAHASHKARVYVESGAILFVESEYDQAQQIANLSDRPVLALEGQRMLWPESDRRAQRRYIKHYANSWPHPRSAPARLIAAIAGETGLAAAKRLLRRAQA